MVKRYSLQELVEYKKNVDSQAGSEESSDEVQELALFADALLKGKVDQAARFKVGLEAHIKAAEENLAALNEMLEQAKELMEEAVMLSPEKRLEGTTFTLKMQNNSRASVIIDDPKSVPAKFHKISIADSFPAELETASFYAGVFLKRVVSVKGEWSIESGNFLDCLDVTPEERQILSEKMSFSVNRKDIETALKTDPNGVPGAHLEKGMHLRVDAGKSKTRLLKESN